MSTHPVRSLAQAIMVIVATMLAPAPARAVTVDGQLDPAYTQLSVQSTQNDPSQDATDGQIDFANGSELDAAYAAIDGGVLYLFFAGNLKDTICGWQACTDLGVLNVFIDSQPGGQNPLTSAAPTSFGYGYPGLSFDAGFTPDYWIQYALFGALDHHFLREAWYEAIPAGGGGASYDLGSGTNAGVPGTLSGGTNPWGIQATSDNRNVAGVTTGCGAASGAGITTGMELAIPLAAIGNPVDCFRVSAFIVEPQRAQTLNQVLPPVPPGTCGLGVPSGVHFESIAGNQFFTICPGAVPVRRGTWGALKSCYR
jgi:hypothetical protein